MKAFEWLTKMNPRQELFIIAVFQIRN